MVNIGRIAKSSVSTLSEGVQKVAPKVMENAELGPQAVGQMHGANNARGPGQDRHSHTGRTHVPCDTGT